MERPHDGPHDGPHDRLRTALARLPRVRLAHLPTPLEPAPRAAAELGARELWIKRDDATGLALGGNKTRQLEYVLGHAIAHGHDCVVHGAAAQSNQSRQVAAAGARLGLPVHLTPWLDPDRDALQGNLLLTTLPGPTVHPVAPGESVIDAKRAVVERLRAEGWNPYVIGMGAPEALTLAAVAYVGAFLELVAPFAETEDARLPDRIYVSSQGSTQAGLTVAARALGAATRVIGVNPMTDAQEAYQTPDAILAVARDAAERLELDVPLGAADIENTTAYVGDGYGVPSDGAIAAIRFAARTEGLILDPVYSGKAFAGLIDAYRSGEVHPEERVTFVHTGGLPALFAHAGRFGTVADSSAVDPEGRRP